MLQLEEITTDIEGQSVYTLIGYAVQCMLYNKNYSLYPIVSIQIWTEHAIVHRQIKFVFDVSGEPVAYLTWAYLKNDTVERLIHDPYFRLHSSEWNEDGDMWILDFCCKPGYGRVVINYLKKIEIFKNRHVCWLTRKKIVKKLFVF